MDAWPLLSRGDRLDGFRLLESDGSEELFDRLESRDQAELLDQLAPRERRTWMRCLDPDDAADLIQESADESRPALLELLDETTRHQVTALLAYKEDEAGGLMNPRYARLRPEMTVDEALSYLRRQNPERVQNLNYPYVLDQEQRLLGVVSLRRLVASPTSHLVRDIMNEEVICVDEGMDQEQVSEIFAEHDLIVIPVVDARHHVKGIVTVDDIVDVVREEATEDMHKIGGSEALDAPYLQVRLLEIVRKRVVWLAVLLVLEFMTVLVMRGFDETLKRAVILAAFVPLIIASGGNSGSQAATLVVRAMALGEVRLRDWWRVIRREIAVGLLLGSTLGALGLCVALTWYSIDPEPFKGHALAVASTVAMSVLCVALWGTLAGSTLPLLLQRLGLDPASASAPLVATLVDASGLLIYFTIAGLLLTGTLL